jgi:hypothetical protein
MTDTVSIGRVDAFRERARGRRCILFGAEAAARELLDSVDIDIAFVVDNDEGKWGNFLRDYDIRPPTAIADADKDACLIVIASSAVEEITSQLRALGVAKNSIVVSPFIIDAAAAMAMPPGAYLVSCIGHNGGLYRLDAAAGDVTRILDGDCRGVLADGDGYVVVMQDNGLVRLDGDFQMVVDARADETMNLHGIARPPGGDILYVNETARDRIGVYDAKTLDKVDAIPFDNGEGRADDHHLNDVVFADGRLVLSMFSLGGTWQDDVWDDGAIAVVDAETGRLEEVLVHGLGQPHSILMTDEGVVFCNSMECEVRQGDAILCRFNGYTRGVAEANGILAVGQSRMRRLARFRDRFDNISMDCGVHFWDRQMKTSRFVHLPAEGVFDIMALES